MTKQIDTLKIGSLRNEEHYGFVDQCVEKCAFLPDEKAEAQQAALTAAVAEENKVLEASQSSETTASLTASDHMRDESWNNLRIYVNIMAQHPDPEVRAAANRLKKLLETYGDPRQMPYIQENGVLKNLIEDLETAKAVADLKKINGETWVAELKKYNTEFMRLFSERTNTNSTKEKGLIKEARTKTDEAYRELIQIINALAILEGESAYTAFINAMNELISYQRTVLTRRKTVAGKKAENKAEQPSADKKEEGGEQPQNGEEQPKEK